jgi:predicted nucleic acid-binding protein
MNKILIDTMHIVYLLTDDGSSYQELSQALDDEKITGVISVVTLTELIKILGEKIYREKINELVSLNVIFVDIDQTIAIRAGELRMRHGLPTGDSLIAATGLIENVKHVLTDDTHFDTVRNYIKPINLKTALKMAK